MISEEDKKTSISLLHDLAHTLKNMEGTHGYIDLWDGYWKDESIIHHISDNHKWENVEVEMTVKITFKNQPEYIQLPHRFSAYCGHDSGPLGGAKDIRKEITVDDTLFVYRHETDGCKSCDKEEEDRRILEAKEYLNNQTEK